MYRNLWAIALLFILAQIGVCIVYPIGQLIVISSLLIVVWAVILIKAITFSGNQLLRL